ncbi:glycoside hydrolase family 3 N-terminal domain-containing protein [Nocardioides sp. Iso805N]|uniref:glycoside hydrolase family 3 N-terminal domain-containing protein n=1 Tax=Nocardioides sp. Iso805N TaxID=1283287 RepID=UPI000382328E|nr:glycoside hydrolase family 3 N-terminal domain-containing protein [Nocardioides sp. Iso805N]
MSTNTPWTAADKAPLQRADDLLQRMTLEEKVMQLSATIPIPLLGADGLLESQAAKLLGSGIGHVSAIGLFGHKEPATIARTVNAIQRFLVERTRLGIPAIFHNEALNGVLAPEFTVFPTAIGLAATWNPETVGEMADLIRRQMRSVGLLQALAPVMDVARDARWGRVHETYGEDPYLVSALSVAFTKGLQGDDLRDGVIATAKHFLGYAMSEGGQNMAATQATARELREVHARPFAAAIELAGLASVMNSYSEVDGIPVGASKEILTGLLRGELGFEGTVVSDYQTVAMLHSRQNVARDLAEAGALALSAGLDVELPAVVGYGPTLADQVRAGAVAEEDLDAAVRRVLRDKFALGLFERPYVDEDPIVLTATARQGVDLARRLAGESVTLLKNEGSILPLSPRLRRIAIVGPHADEVGFAFPGYTYPVGLAMLGAMMGGGDGAMAGLDALGGEMPAEAAAAVGAEFAGALTVSSEDYIRQRYGAVSLADAIRDLVPDAQVTLARGCGVLDSEPHDLDEAVAAAADADVVITAVGGRGGWFFGATTEGEGSDSADIELPRIQRDLLAAVAATGTPVVGVLSTGRPMAIAESLPSLTALAHAYYGGQQGTRAVADALFGITNPGGKLPYSMPRHTGQVPIYAGQHHGSGYRRTASDMHKGYRDMPGTPLFAFGHGLSYTSFEYSGATLSSSTVESTGSVEISVTVKNTGTMGGDEVVQLYVGDTATGLTRPAQELVGFRRISLAPGAARTVTFTVRMDQLCYLGLDRTSYIIEPGPIDVLVGSSSDDIRARARFEVVGPTIQLGRARSYLSESRVE